MYYCKQYFDRIYCCLNHQSVRFRLQAYLAIAIVALLVCLYFLAPFVDILQLPNEIVKLEMEKGLNRYTHNIKEYFNNTAAHGIRFSEIAVTEIEKFLKNKNIYFANIANNQELIKNYNIGYMI